MILLFASTPFYERDTVRSADGGVAELICGYRVYTASYKNANA